MCLVPVRSRALDAIGWTIVVALMVSCEVAESKPPEMPPRPPSEGVGLGNVPNGAAANPPGGLGLTGVALGDVAGGPLDPSRGKGRLAPVIVQTVVRAHFDTMKNCYEDGLRRNAKLQGRVTTRFVIERDGHVSSAVEIPNASAEPQLPDTKVVACVVAAFAALSFPEPEGGSVTVVYPVVFNPGD